MKIGIVDIDTSHPENWIPILRQMGHEIVGLLDHGDVHPRAYVADFAARHEVPRVFTDTAELAAVVDLAIVHSCDWDRHVERARPFVEAGHAVLLDKPLVGCAADLAQVARWLAAGHRVAGGSALLYCAEAAAIRAEAAERQWLSAFVGCGVDGYNYGIHAYSLLVAIFGPGVSTVRHLAGAPQETVLVTWRDGRQGLVSLTNSGWIPFHATVVGPDALRQPQIDAGALYAALLTAVMPYLSGETARPPLPVETWLLPERLALLAAQSRRLGGVAQALGELDGAAGYDGAAYTAYYRGAKYPDA